MLEIDVQFSLDGDLMVLHDDAVNRTRVTNAVPGANAAARRERPVSEIAT